MKTVLFGGWIFFSVIIILLIRYIYLLFKLHTINKNRLEVERKFSFVRYVQIKTDSILKKLDDGKTSRAREINYYLEKVSAETDERKLDQYKAILDILIDTSMDTEKNREKFIAEIKGFSQTIYDLIERANELGNFAHPWVVAMQDSLKDMTFWAEKVYGSYSSVETEE